MPRARQALASDTTYVAPADHCAFTTLNACYSMRLGSGGAGYRPITEFQ